MLQRETLLPHLLHGRSGETWRTTATRPPKGPGGTGA